MYTINWSEKTTDEIYEFHSNIADDKEAISFLIHLIKYYSQVEVDWIEMLVDTMNPLLEKGDIEEVENFVELYQQTFPEEYINEYGFIEKELITHYLFRNDIENVKKRLEIIKQNPVHDADDVTVNALFQLIYHGYYDIALEYSHAVWKPIFEDEELIGCPHFHFSTTIYLHELENIYQLIKSGKQPDIISFKKEMDKYDIDEDTNMYRKVFHNLSRPLNKEDIELKIKNKESDVLLTLNILFLKYMKEKYDIPFMLSDRFWNMLTVFDLFGTEKSADGFLYIPYTILEKHFRDNTDNLFMTNEVEMFGKVWGLNYVYTFLHESGLISDHYFSMMEENIHVLKDEYIKMAFTSLWQMNFVHKWPQIYVPDPYEVRLFEETYKKDEEEIKEKLDNYLALMITPGRIKEEIDATRVTSKKNTINPIDADYDPLETYVRKDPKTGRNDPCPCGSGKKYKKCCLK